VRQKLDEYGGDPCRDQVDAAIDSGLSVSSLHRYATGKAVPQPHNARQLAAWLGLDTREMRQAIRLQERERTDGR
jgi:ribosome-binding protein aMBF1 (putative translation factor)